MSGRGQRLVTSEYDRRKALSTIVSAKRGANDATLDWLSEKEGVLRRMERKFDGDDRETVTIDTTLRYQSDLAEYFAEALWPAIEDLDAGGEPHSGVALGKHVKVTGTLELEVVDDGV